MGFPNVDIFLAAKFIERFVALKSEPTFLIRDTFDDLSAPEQDEIIAYIQRKNFTDDLRDRDDSEVFIFPSFPMFTIPLPQIGISLGDENESDRFFRDTVGDATPHPTTGTQTHWAIPKGYIAASNYQIDVVCATKDEVVWLSRLIQRFIVDELDTLDSIGVQEVSISLQDTVIKTEHQPMTAFARQVRMSCKVHNTWTKLLPLTQYQTGVNGPLPLQSFTQIP